MIGRRESKANRGRNLIAVLMAALGLLLLSGRPVRAQEWTKQDKPQNKQAKRRIIPVTINKGETYVISDVSEGGAPGIKPVANPNALVVRTDAPGKIVPGRRRCRSLESRRDARQWRESYLSGEREGGGAAARGSQPGIRSDCNPVTRDIIAVIVTSPRGATPRDLPHAKRVRRIVHDEIASRC